MITLLTTLIPVDAHPPCAAQVTGQGGDKLEGNLFLGFADLFWDHIFLSPHIATYPPSKLNVLEAGAGI